MANRDLEYLEEVLLKVRRTKRWTKSFTVIRDAGHHRAVNENVNSDGSAGVSDPSGT